jgi:uncharacterized protein YukE
VTRMGMDVDAVERFGRDLKAQASQILSLVGTVDQYIDRAGSLWEGPGAGRYVGQWRGTDAPRLRRLAAMLTNLGQQAINNAQAQREVSGRVDGGAGRTPAFPVFPGSSPGVPGGPIDWRAGKDFLDRWGDATLGSGFAQATGILGFLGTIGTHNKFGHYPDWLQRATHDASFFHYNKSPILFDSDLLRRLGDNPIMTGLDRFGKGLTVVERASDLYNAFANPGATAEDKVHAVGDSAASAMKMSKNPVVYLAGVATSSVTNAVAEGTKVDWSAEGFSGAWNEIRKDPGILAEEFGKAAQEMFTKKIWSFL